MPDQESANLDGKTRKMERNYLEKEFIRFQEFVELSENAHETEPKVMQLKEQYHLLHI